MDDLFEKITNEIAIMIREDAALTQYCIDNLGFAMNPTDNSITHSSHKGQIPFFVITKGEEEHFFNRGTASGTKRIFPCHIIFVGDFAAEQADDNAFVLPSGAEDNVNGIKTYTPSDVMRKIARKAGDIVNENIECKIPQLRVESYTVFSEGYYDYEDGTIGSVLSINMYQENNGYSN